MPIKNINLENEIFAAHISDAQAIYALRLTLESIIIDLKANSLEYVTSTIPPTAKIKKWLNKYGTVILIKEDNAPQITVFTRNEVIDA